MNSKPTLVCLPGLLCDERVWTEQADHLKDFCKPQIIDLRPCSTLDEMIDKVSSSGDELYLAGFSMGGYVAQEFLVRFPEKVKKIALIAISATGYTPELKEKIIGLRGKAKQGVFDSVFGKNLEQWLSSTSMKSQKLVDSILDMEKLAGIETYLRQTGATLERRDLREELKKHSIPALIVGGAEDDVVPVKQVQELASSLPNAKLRIIDECGHFVALEQPEVLNSLMKEWVLR